MSMTWIDRQIASALPPLWSARLDALHSRVPEWASWVCAVAVAFVTGSMLLDGQSVTSRIEAFDLIMLVLFAIALTLMSVALVGAAARQRRVGRASIAGEPLDDRVRAALDAVPVDVMGFDAERRLLHLNQSAQKANAWADTSTWIGKTFEEVLWASVDHFRSADPGRDWQAWVDERSACYDAGATTDVHRPCGDWRRAHIVSTPGGGRLLIRLDITELKIREEMLAASERRYAELVDSLPDVVISVDSNGCIEYASNVAIDVLGCAADGIRGRPLLSLVSAIDHPRLAELLDRVRSGSGEACSIICEVLRERDGAERFLQFHLKRKSPTGAPSEDVVIGGVIRDVHDQQTIALKLEREMEQLSSVFQSNGAYFLLLDREERVVMMNQTLRDFGGYGDRDLTGVSYRTLGDTGLSLEIVKRWQAASGPERLAAVEFEGNAVDRAGKAHIAKITATPVQDKMGRLRYIVLIGVDDTERRLAEIRLFDTSRLTNLGEMASGIAHEINQPLAVIRLASDSLCEELDMPEAETIEPSLRDLLKRKLERIGAQTERASGIIRELRTLARKPSDDPRPFHLADVARGAADLLREQLRAARIDLSLDLPTSSGPSVRGEASRLQQVAISMALNARDAILERPTSCESGTLGRIDMRVESDSSSGRAILVIEDDGPGLPPAVLSRLFEPFFTTKPAGKGTGLGLSIGYDIVRRMGGEISAENRPEGGARFRLSLPLLPRQFPEAAVAAE
jgi:PAS domain S-box-containing protein